MRLCSKHLLFTFAVASASVFVMPSALHAADTTADDAVMKEELKYVEALVNANMPDFAEPVINAARTKWPQLAPKLKVLALQGALRLGKFAEVQKAVDAIKDKKSGEYWALRLSMADAYFARGMMKECREIYQAFFKAVPKPGPDLADFYVESAFKWAQMLEREKQFDEAVKVYDGLLAQKDSLPEERWCAIAMQSSELLIRLAEENNAPKTLKKRDAYLKQAEKYVDALLWKQDLIIVFGKAIAMKAHIEMVKGNLQKAQEIVSQYMPDLSAIHKSLVEQDPRGEFGYVRMSPMPECRYLLAKVLWEAVKVEDKSEKPDTAKIADALFGAKVKGKRNGLGAYNHAINVFVNYPESSWAADAGELTEAIAKFVKARFKKEIKTNITKAQMAKVRQMQFVNAHEAYRGNDYEKAIKDYLEILARFTTVEESVEAVANLADSYLQLWLGEKNKQVKENLRLNADAVEGYLAEYFSGKTDSMKRAAGDRVLSLAAHERDAGSLARAQGLYDMYFTYYPDHYNAAQMAYRLAGEGYKVEDWDKAIHYYKLIATAYTNSANYVKSLQMLAVCYGKADMKAEQEAALRQFVNVAKLPTEKISAQFNLGIMQQKRGFASFESALETNDVEVAEAMNKAAYTAVAGAIRDFRAVETAITAELAKTGQYNAKEKTTFARQREQALLLEGDSWQRLAYPADKVKLFRAQAVKAFEKYLELYPKGEYGAQILVKIGTIHTAEKDMDKSQAAFARLQEMFPQSDEAKNSVPRLARTLMEMGLKSEGVAQYKQMIETKGGKYTAGQFIAAGDALLDAKSWDVAQEAYAKAMTLAKGTDNEKTILARALLGQAKAFYGAKQYVEAHQKLEQFIEKYGKSSLVIEAYEMVIRVASERGRTERDDEMRLRFFNEAVGALKKVRQYRKSQADQDLLDLRSGDVLVRKMEAEDAMDLKEQAKETCGRAVVTFQAFIMAHEPTAEHPAKDMTGQQLANLERCYSTVLPLMARLGKDQKDLILKYGETYLELFPNGKNKTAVQNAINQAKAE